MANPTTTQCIESSGWFTDLNPCEEKTIKISLGFVSLFAIGSFILIGLAASHHLGAVHSLNLTHLPPSPTMHSLFQNYSYIGS